MAEQIKQANDSLDAVVLEIKVPSCQGDESDARVREITEMDEENERVLIVKAHAVQSTSQRKNIKL